MIRNVTWALEVPNEGIVKIFTHACDCAEYLIDNQRYVPHMDVVKWDYVYDKLGYTGPVPTEVRSWTGLQFLRSDVYKAHKRLKRKLKEAGYR